MEHSPSDPGRDEAQSGPRVPGSHAPGHVPVLAGPVQELLSPCAGEVYVDATAGLGGHAADIAPSLAPGGTVVLNDLDPGNLEEAEAHVRSKLAASDAESDVRIVCVHGNFGDLPDALKREGLVADMLLADLGFASVQVDDPQRGLSFRFDGPLDMRLDPGGPVLAQELVNTLDAEELARVLREFGEERSAWRIAQKIVDARRSGPIQTTTQLAEIVRSATGAHRHAGPRIDPATKTFQALRIAVNDELGSLDRLLDRFVRASARAGDDGSWVRPGTRAAWISFHSLEDRAVKQALKALCAEGHAKPLTRKPAIAGDDERSQNPRSRSAKLRAVEVVANDGEPLPFH